MKILIIEDERITRITLSNTLKKEGFDVYTADDFQEGLALFTSEEPEIVITDLRLPNGSGIDILQQIMGKNPNCKVILITAYATVETAVEALKFGAYDYLTKPFSPEELLAILRNIRQLQSVISENTELRTRIQILEDKTIIGNSNHIKKLIETIKHIAQNDFTVLIEGESGTGKELIARSLHQNSLRKNNSFITVSCSSIPESLLESELFGHEKGSFTGAVKRHQGYFERANKGTLFMDNIDDFPFNMQVKLLRVIQEREFTRVGGSEIINLDLRIIAATKINLKERVEQKLFREDLYYRLNIIPLKLKPLRERKEDILPLIEHFFRKHNSLEKLKLITKELYADLINYDWRGNVRELENIVERMIALSYMGEIDRTILEIPKTEIIDTVKSSAKDNDNIKQLNYDFTNSSLEEIISRKEAEIIKEALNKCDNNITLAAKMLKVPRTTLSSKIERLMITIN